jgi:hypothetical protein
MNRIFALFFLIVLPSLCYAQKRSPDYQEIKKKITDTNSVYFHPKLVDRYRRNDTTLQADEYRYLYYGTLFTKEYLNEYDLRPKENGRLSILLQRKELSGKEKRQLVKTLEDVLYKNPFDINSMYILTNVYEKFGDTVNAKLYFNKVSKIIKTILDSGDGLTPETAFHVIDVSHEYAILAVYNYELSMQQFKSEPVVCDYLSVKSNKDNVDGLYFNISQIFEQKKYNTMRPRKWYEY